MARTFLQILGLCAVVPLAAAAPVLTSRTNSNEIYYLVNCSKDVHTGNTGSQYYHSLMAYYSDQSKSMNSQVPTAISAASGTINWEGKTILGSFTGAKDPDFSSTIESNGVSDAVFNLVGTGKTETREFAPLL